MGRHVLSRTRMRACKGLVRKTHTTFVRNIFPEGVLAIDVGTVVEGSVFEPVAVVLARTGELLDSRGISAFIVERGTPGFKGGKKENRIG